MSDPDLRYHDDDSSWQLLAEFLIPNTLDLESQVVDHISGILRQLGMELGQLSQILSVIKQSLKKLEGDITPLRLRISVSGVDLKEMLPDDQLAHQGNLDLNGRGFGFFLIKRIVGQLHDLDTEKYRLLDVLIYREGGRTRD